jgi:hypothetical protein
MNLESGADPGQDRQDKPFLPGISKVRISLVDGALETGFWPITGEVWANLSD